MIETQIITLETKVSELQWKTTSIVDTDTLHVIGIPDVGRLTVLHRLTGYGDGTIFDIETGFTSVNDKFWLASGDKDVRRYEDFTVAQAIEWVKSNANNCVGE